MYMQTRAIKRDSAHILTERTHTCWNRAGDLDIDDKHLKTHMTRKSPRAAHSRDIEGASDIDPRREESEKLVECHSRKFVLAWA